VGAECEAAEQHFGAAIVRLPEPDLQADLDGVAALLAACDLIITTSNVTAHLTGALGRPGWVLLPQRIGRLWYWFHERADSPWYPSLALMPQLRDGDWSGLMELAGQRLRAKLAAKS
jgi:ADP-heptose:LPS heptosyltransferase